MSSQPAIHDYAVIGDGRSAVLVSREASIDWLCWPRFDSPAVFARILDANRGGCWRIAPVGDCRTQRRYVVNTNVLETTFTMPGGRAILVDFMPVASLSWHRAHLAAEQELARHLECTAGEVTFEIVYMPRPEYGQRPARLHDAGPFGIWFDYGAARWTLQSSVPLAIDEEGAARGKVSLSIGETADFCLSFNRDAPAVFTPPTARERLDRSIAWWREWAAQAVYEGPYRDAVIRSALVLKLLMFAPSGAVVAAPTTSLPERLGGDLNWDYRYCWLRDASFTVRAFFGLGYPEEAEIFIRWMLHATRLTRPKLNVLYDVYGRTHGKETEVPLEGHRSSKPVRIGNAAARQLQLDTYGEVIEAAWHFVEHGGCLDREATDMLEQLGDYVCRHWHEPDAGIWESREPPAEYTHSRVMCWRALDRLVALAEQGHLPKRQVTQREKLCQSIRRDMERAWNSDIPSYTQTLTGKTLDASLMLMALHGFEPPSSPRMRSTYAAIEKRLTAGKGLLYRYERSRETKEGAFGLCSFWRAEYLALGGGTLDDAHRAFADALGYVNDVGLFGEEIDPASGQALGNFPQAYTHVGLISAALTLNEREKREAAMSAREFAAGSFRETPS